MNTSHTQQGLTDFVSQHALTMTTERAASNPNMGDDEWSRSAHHYICTIRNADGASMNITFSMGSGLKGAPTIEMVLDAVASDVASVENAPDWLDWAEEMGADMEAESLRQLRSAHETITQQAGELRDLLGDEALETLLWNTERL